MAQLDNETALAISKLQQAISKLQQKESLTDDEVMNILSVLNPENPKLERILYAAFCAIQGGEEDIETLYRRANRWMDYERS